MAEVLLGGTGPVLEGEGIRLRPLSWADLAAAYVWNNDPEILYFSEGDEVRSRSFDQIIEMYRTISSRGFLYAVEDASGKVIGEAFLTFNTREARAAQLGLVIGQKDLWAQGYGRRVVSRMLSFAFEQLKLERVLATGILADNVRSLRLFQGCGFVPVKRERACIRKGNRLLDAVTMAISRGEFLQAQARRAGSSWSA